MTIKKDRYCRVCDKPTFGTVCRECYMIKSNKGRYLSRFREATEDLLTIEPVQQQYYPPPYCT